MKTHEVFRRGPGEENGRVPGVIVWDDDSWRLERLQRVAEQCGVRVRSYEEFVACRTAKETSALESPIGLVGLGGSAPNGRGWRVARALKGLGRRVICYEDHASSWPMGLQAQVLLAGATLLLDSASSTFPDELRRKLSTLLDATLCKLREGARMARLMGKMGIVGSSVAMADVFRWVCKVSHLSDCSALITGETGTGKELLARAVHRLDRNRCRGPFVAVNCSALSRGLVESELFGHRSGAFTGATCPRKGLVRCADGGILFLDEVGELDAATQAKLLRVLEEKRVRGVGEDGDVSVDVRIVAATHRNLNAMVEQGTFRADLYHRLHVLSVHLPAMRERKADVALLVDHFLAKYQPLAPVQGLSVDPSFVAALEQCDWPGNVRQLENTIRQAVVEKENDACLRWQDLPADILRQLARRGESGGPDRDLDRSPCERVPSRDGTGLLTSALSVLFEDKGWNLRRCLAQCEKTLLVAALARNDYNQARAARQLGITARSMYNKMCKHALRRNSDALPAERVAPGVCEPTNTSWTRRAATSTA